MTTERIDPLAADAVPQRTPARAAALPQLALAAVCLAYATGGAFGWGSREVALFMGDFGLSAAALLAAVSCYWYARTHRGESRPAWYLFALSSAMAGLGNAVWGWYEVVLGRPVPATSLADYCFLLFAPPAIVGLLVLAKRPVSRAGWVCLGLDAWLIGGSLLTLSWSLALAHTGAWGQLTVAHAALQLAYPLLDIALVSMVLVLHLRRTTAQRSAVNTAVGALALTVLCDALFTSPLLQEHYRSGQLLDAGWFAGSLLLAYAPWAGGRPPHGQVPRTPPARAAGRPVSGSLAALTPYLAGAVCLLGVLYDLRDGGPIDLVVLLTACAVVLALVVRQGIMLMDNIRLARELAHKESHFRSLVQGSSDVIMITSPTGLLRYVSPAAARVFGREAEALVGSELDRLVHPEDVGRLHHEVRRFLAAPPEQEPATRIECRFRHAAGEWLNVESTVNRYQGGLIFNSRDVTERVRLQAQLQHSASHDALTDLPNRALFTDRVHQALTGRREGDGPGRDAAVLFIDLDGFKAVNDRLGHQAGDELLVQAGRRLLESVRAGDTAARLGGDEFAALIVGDGPGGGAEREVRVLEIADRLRARLSEPYALAGGPEDRVRVAASIGVAFAEPGVTPAQLMRNADLAMYRAKRTGKGRVELYGPELLAQAQPPAHPVPRHEARPVAPPRPARRRGGRRADGELVLLHQPVVELATGDITAVEALPRVRSPQGLADAGRGASTGRHLLREAVAQAAERHRAGLTTPVAVRVGARLLALHPGAEGSVEALLERYGLPAGGLVLELGPLGRRPAWGPGHRRGLDRREELTARLAALRDLGALVTLDAFGGGPGALCALDGLPVDVLRLDAGLVEGLVGSPRLHTVTAGLLRIAGELGLDSLATGVSAPEQVTVLRRLGCTHGQGPLFAGPLDEHRLRRVLARGGYPVPERAATVPAARSAGRPVVVAAALPVRRSGTAGPDPVTHPPVGSHSETSVPPT
ncbi:MULTISPECIES: putative bifunctional diguanylate cyclase/phosphodiesterase [Streptomyces]|uniref:putative bifunctional diguanylate cyclase/phosphodiesterase n=1 Tax=Streptomyces TaxID=1883 RepID=UPI002248992C|nr:diguanylate cyclase [Streptomyces sp. JHD 1]MCX2967440.1 diguanylate cyclase [Streptomyces sp. JHD 1]